MAKRPAPWPEPPERWELPKYTGPINLPGEGGTLPYKVQIGPGVHMWAKEGVPRLYLIEEIGTQIEKAPPLCKSWEDCIHGSSCAGKSEGFCDQFAPIPPIPSGGVQITD